jgi:hypothetical protein
MFEIPRQQEIHASADSHRDVSRIESSPLRNRPLRDKISRQRFRLLGQSDIQDTLQFVQPSLRDGRISFAGLSEDELGDVQIEISPPCRPPLSCNLLTACRHDIPARVGGQIADDGGLDVHPGFHENLLAASSHIQVPHFQRVVLDELAPRLDFVAHEDGEDRIGFDVVLDADAEEAASRFS